MCNNNVLCRVKQYKSETATAFFFIQFCMSTREYAFTSLSTMAGENIINMVHTNSGSSKWPEHVAIWHSNFARVLGRQIFFVSTNGVPSMAFAQMQSHCAELP
jgi:hypothetical protein